MAATLHRRLCKGAKSSKALARDSACAVSRRCCCFAGAAAAETPAVLTALLTALLHRCVTTQVMYCLPVGLPACLLMLHTCLPAASPSACRVSS
jgi:hypothetical protein